MFVLGGIILPAFNEPIWKEMFAISLPFLDSSEMFLFMISFHNALVQFLKHQYNAPMVGKIV